MQDDGTIRAIDSDHPVKVDEMLLTEADKERLEGLPPEDRHEELKRMNEDRLRALSKVEYEAIVVDAGNRVATEDPPQSVDTDYDQKVAIAYNLMRDALLGPTPVEKAAVIKGVDAKAKARKKSKRKAADKSKRNNR